MNFVDGKIKLQLAIDPVLWTRRLSLIGSACAVLGTAFYMGWRNGLARNAVDEPSSPDDQALEIENILSQFDLTDEHLSKVMSLLEDEMNKGLDPATVDESDLKMIPSYVRNLPNGKECGKIIALDLGGTNFRVLEVDLSKDGLIETNSKMFVIPKKIMVGPGEELFEYLASSVYTFMKAQQLSRRSKCLPCGFTFSFPCAQLAINSAELITWTKGFKCSDVVGKDVVALLDVSLNKRKKANLDIMAILNDTVGTLMNCAYHNQYCKIGVIFGTGTNACYVEDLERVKTWKGDIDEPKQVIINTEWGAFGDHGCLEFIRTRYDDDVDISSANPGKQKFEKMISGMYMGELARVIIQDLMTRNLIFRGMLEGKRVSNKDEDPKKLIAAGTFYTKFVSDVETDEGVAFSRAKQLMEDFGINRLSYADCAVLKQICERLSRRGALMSAAAIAVLVNRIGLSKITIGVDGSLYRCHPNFKKNLDMGLSRLIARYINYNVVLSNDGSGRGAAICAAVQQRMKDEVSIRQLRKELDKRGQQGMSKSVSASEMSSQKHGRQQKGNSLDRKQGFDEMS